MSSAVRGQANLHDSVESNSSNSNKRKRVVSQNPSMHHQLNDQLLQKQEEEAAALLNHMHLMNHGDLSAGDRMHIDRDQGYAAGDHQVMLRHATDHSAGSSDASAAYFSGDSDLTAEPIMGCAADEEGAKSSNSGGTTPLKLLQAVPRTDQAHALACHEYSINHLRLHNDNGNNNIKGQASRTSTPPIAGAPGTSTSSQNYKTFDSENLSSSQIMHMHGGAQATAIIGCNRSRPQECVNSVRELENCWLDLRLGQSTELHCGLVQNHEASIAGDGPRRSRESSVDVTESAPVTLQLMPEKPDIMETYSSSAAAAIRSSMLVQEPHIVNGSSLYSSLPSVYQPFSHIGTKFDGKHLGAAATSGHPQFLSKDPAASLDYPDHQQFLLDQSNDPAAALHQSRGRPALARYEADRLLYDQVQAFSECNDQRRWAAAETSDVMMMTTKPMIPAARPTEIHRPTASLGWPPSISMVSTGEARAWSANSYTTPLPQLQSTMSWQGLLRSMATDPLLHTLPELSMRSFDTGAETCGPRRHPLFPACPRPPSSRASAPPAPINYRHLQLSTAARRNMGLWFSLQEGDHFLNENVEDHQHKEQLSNQPMQKIYLRIMDGKMQISVLQNYLIRKLGSAGAHQYNNTNEVEITCRGKVLAPNLTIQHVRDTIWLNKEFELGEAIGFRHTNSYLSESHNTVMALCYQRHHTQTVTLNLLKT